jgi:hypothetical protein
MKHFIVLALALPLFSFASLDTSNEAYELIM